LDPDNSVIGLSAADAVVRRFPAQINGQWGLVQLSSQYLVERLVQLNKMKEEDVAEEVHNLTKQFNKESIWKGDIVIAKSKSGKWLYSR
jgi:hypothetical protein